MYLKDYPVPSDNDPRIKKQLVTLENGKAVITPDSLPSLYVISPASMPQMFIRLTVEPGDHVTVKFESYGDGYIYTASGTAAADGMTDYLKTVRSTDMSIDSMVQLLNGDPQNKEYFATYDSLSTAAFSPRHGYAAMPTTPRRRCSCATYRWTRCRLSTMLWMKTFTIHILHL